MSKNRVTPDWMKDKGLVEIRPGVYGRAILPKALNQQTPDNSLFSGTPDDISSREVQYEPKNKNGLKKPVNHVTGYVEDKRILNDLLLSMRATDIFIPGNPISSKNHKVIGKIGSEANGTRRTILRKADTALQYEKDTIPYLTLNKLKFKAAISELKKPYHLYFTIIMNKRIRFDYVNIVQLILDLMQSEPIGMLDDDDFSNVVPVFNRDVFLSQTHPGLLIQVIKGITINY